MLQTGVVSAEAGPRGAANKFKGNLRWGSRGRGDELACSKARVVGP